MQITVSKKFLFIVTGIIVVLLSVFGLYYLASSDNNTKNTAILSETSAGFKTYYPSTLPPDYELDTASLQKTNDDMIFYTLKNPKTSEYITISQQTVPNTVKPEAILRQPNKEPVQLEIGTMYDKSSTEQKTYVIATKDNVLIYVNPSNKTDQSTVQNVITALKHF